MRPCGKYHIANRNLKNKDLYQSYHHHLKVYGKTGLRLPPSPVHAQ